MKKVSLLVGVGLTALFALGCFTFIAGISRSLSQTSCCPPSTRAASVPRFPQGATVQVYIDIRTGFRDYEKQAIKEGLEDWNDEPNNTNITFVVQETDNPPTLPPTTPGSNIIVIVYEDQQNPDAIAETQTVAGTNGVWNIMIFYQNIRNVWNEEVGKQLIRGVARHEGAHTLGLDHPTDPNCSPGSTIMLLPISGEGFITPCDNETLDEDPAFGTPTPTPCAGPSYSCSDLYPCCPGYSCGEWNFVCIDCQPNPQDAHESCMSQACISCYANGGVYCTGYGNCWTPIVVDVQGNGFNLTNAANGVNFNDGNGAILRTAWTSENSDDAWLVLDRNSNGKIDDGTELFGNAAPQAPVTNELRNGFRALSEYDRAINGGNEDGLITNQDAVFASLRLWQDINHDGVSVVSELHSLPSFELATIDLTYKPSKYKDHNGNTFKFRARLKDIHGAQLGRWVYDVFLDAYRAQ